MKKFLKYNILVLSVLTVFAKAQETVPYYHQYLLGGEYLFNPSYFGTIDDVVVNGFYQKQFSKLSEGPSIQSLGIHANVVDRVGAGAYFFRDQNGPISSNGLAVGASYFIPIGDDDSRTDAFSFGAGVNFYNMNVDWSQINAKDPNDPYLQDGSNSIFIAYINLGMQFSYQSFFGELSAVNIPLTNKRSIVNGIEQSPTRYFLHTGYEYALDEGFSVQPSVMFNLDTNSSRMTDLNFIAKVSDDRNYFAGGLSYRIAKTPFGSQQLSLSPLIKAEFNRLTFGAVYNFSMSKLSNFGGNSFMLSLGYNFENFINSRGFRYR
ncbi:PorP/SprF family type IX secretion system membrane protein [Riemerella columbipharyngis]|uniref:Type IX secretion system membrane protein, PorP/SprF family n=1 Tax=Riemerella columbipharyngis TaxID=1071918 RepID=A0A1G7AXK5_9FLAO|nr:PorP/SprF family type IX secretion system membrane protein [Riemerella columbipharyngis]SDE19442.1 type IX secretion system membrane protein, PorP/SprF family [Riemerella columbipharyngis]